jgi:hypothetical protein
MEIFCKKVEELKTGLKSAQKYNELLTKLEEEILLTAVKLWLITLCIICKFVEIFGPKSETYKKENYAEKIPV